MKYTIVLLFFVLLSCLNDGKNVSNQKDNFLANIEQNDSIIILTLKKKQKYMKHNVASLFDRKKYLDSIQLILPRTRGIILGKEIPVRKGYYTFLGQLYVKDTLVVVRLITNNTDDKIQNESRWNGVYHLAK